ncbi:hypothetical protein ACIOD2_43480 [Amycolatopsis sp. NPDC088138]|uniref:hypothetical protein n=1 Tax=Amycolatopsis sp. NPDC088138 TaxID=3363938 RepID=UPI0038257A63
MQVYVGILGGALGGILGGIVTFLATRTKARLELLQAHDLVLQTERLARYQRLFHLSGRLPRYWRPGEAPGRQDLAALRQDLHDWYFGEEAGGLFLTQHAKTSYLKLQNALVEAMDVGETPLSDHETRALRDLAGELRHQLSADIGAANPPRVKTRYPGSTLPPPEPYS